MANHPLPTATCVQILRLPQVCKVTGLGRSMIYQLEAQQRFPCRVRIGARAVGWVEAEVQGWLGVGEAIVLRKLAYKVAVLEERNGGDGG